MKVFLSQKFNGLEEEEIMKVREDAVKHLKSRYGEDIEVIDNYHHEGAPLNAGRLWHLGESIKMMEEADAVYFCPGWESANGCRVEFKICEIYRIRILK